MRVSKLTGVVLVTVWLQLQLLGAMRPFGVLPNLLLLVIIYAGLSATATETVVMAVTGGLMLDLASGSDFGLRMAFYCALALAMAVARRSGANFEHAGLIVGVTVIGTVVYNLAVLAGLLGMINLRGWGVISRPIAVEVLVNLVLVLLLGPVLSKMVRSPTGQALSFSRGVK